MSDIHHVQQCVGLCDLFERGAERGHQLRGQLLDETDRVGEQDRVPTRQAHATGRRVECREELVLDQHIGIGQGVQQRRLAGVGVTDNRDHRNLVAAPVGAVLRPLFAHFLQIFAQSSHALADAVTVNFQLLFAGAAQSDAAVATAASAAASLACKVRPLPREPRQTILILRQLHLQGAFARLGVLCENIEDQCRAVEHGHVFAQRFL